MTELETALLEAGRGAGALRSAISGLADSINGGFPANTRKFARLVERRAEDLVDAARRVAERLPPADGDPGQ